MLKRVHKEVPTYKNYTFAVNKIEEIINFFWNKEKSNCLMGK